MQESWLWVPDAEETALPYQAVDGFSKGDAAACTTPDGKAVTLSAEQTASAVPMDPQVLSPRLNDLIQLDDLNEFSILHKIRMRFADSEVYTSISSILISVNPFKGEGRPGHPQPPHPP